MAIVLAPDEPLAVSITSAIQIGDVARLRQLLDEQPELARAWIGPRSLLHVATDWPGDPPNAAATVTLLIDLGADVNARFAGGQHSETPLHWAASGDNVDVLDALLDAGADIEAPGAVIAGGTPLSDAVAFGQWNAARRLVERGAATPLREAAALGLIDRVEAAWAHEPPSAEDTTQAFWYACHGGRQAAAEYLLDRGADIDWLSTWDHLTPLDAAVRSEATDLAEWLRRRGAHPATQCPP